MPARLLPRSILGCAVFGLGLVTVTGVGLLGFLGYLGTDGGNRFLLNRVEDAVSLGTDGGLQIGDLEVGRDGMRVDHLVLTDATGHPLVSVDRLVAEYRLGRVLHRELSMPHVRMEGVSVDVTADANGVTDLSRLFGGPSARPSGSKPFQLPFALDLPDVDLHTVNVRYSTPNGVAFALSGASGQAAISGRGSRVQVDRLGLVGQIAAPGPVTTRITGDLVYDDAHGLTLHEVRVEVPHGVATANGSVGDDVDLGVRVDRLEARALDPFTGDVGIGGVWVGSVAAKGTGKQFDLEASVTGIERSKGAFSLAGHVDRTRGAPDWSALAQIAELHVEHLWPSLEQPVVVDGLVDLQGSGTGLGTDLRADGTWKGGTQILYGQPVERVSATFALENGVLHLADSDLDGIVGELTVTGDVDLVKGPVSLRAHGPLSPARLAAFGVDGLDGDGTVDAQITTDLRHADAGILVDGVVDYAPFRYPNVEIARLVAPFTTTLANGRIDGRVNLHGGRFDALGMTGSTIDGNRIRFEKVGPTTRVTGPLALRGLDYDGYLEAARGDADFDFTLSGTHRTLTATVAVGDWTLAQRPGGDGTVTVGLNDDALVYAVALADQGRAVLDTSGTFDLGTEQVVLDQLRYAPTPRVTWTSARPLRMVLTDGGIRDADLAVASPLGTLQLTGQIGVRGPLDAAITIRGFQLDHVAELYPESYDGLAGLLDLDLMLTGDAASPVVDGQVDLQQLFVQDQVRWLDVKGPVHLAGGSLQPDLALAVAGTPFGQLDGHLPVTGGLSDLGIDRNGAMDLELALFPGDFARLVHVAPLLDGRSVPVGRLSADLHATGSVQDPVLRLAGVSEVQVPEWSKVARVEFDLTRDGTQLALDADLREGLETRATMTGTAETRLGEVFAYLLPPPGGPAPVEPVWDDYELYVDRMDASAALVGVPVARLAELAGSTVALAGDLVGGLTVTGSPTRPVVDGAVNWLDPKVGEQKLTGAYLSLVPAASGGYTLDTDFRFPNGSLAVAGAVPVTVDFDREVAEWASGDLALKVSGDGVPLAVLSAFDPAIRSSGGKVVLDGQIGGSVDAPRPDLVATIDGGQIGYPPLGIIAGDLHVAARITETQVELQRADFTLTPNRRFQPLGLVSQASSLVEGAFVEGAGTPRASITGTVQLDDHGMPGQVDAKVTLLDGAWLSSTEEQTLRATGGIGVGGAWPRLAIDGDLRVDYGQVAIDTVELESGTPLELDPSLIVARAGQVEAPARPVAAPPWYSDFDVNVKVDLRRNLELAMTVPFLSDFGEVGAQLSRADVAARLGGVVQVQMQGGQPALVGSVDVVDGSVRLLRSSLKLDEGTLSFAGGDPYLNTSLDLHGSMTVSGGELDVAITGSPAEPVFTPSSDAYPDRTQQLAILLTGKAPDELTADQGSAAVSTIATTALSTLLSGRTFGSVTIAPDSSVRVGIPLTSSIYATSVLYPMQVDPDGNSVALQLEWSPARRLVLSGGVGDRVDWGDVYWEVRF